MEKNPIAANLLIKQQADSNVAGLMIGSLFSTMPGGVDSITHLAVANLPSEQANNALLAIAARYATKSPKDALNALSMATGGPIGATGEAYRKIFESLFAQDPDYAIRPLATFDSAATQSVLSNKSSLERAIELNSAVAIESMDKIALTSANADLFKNASFILAQKDPQMAFDWIGGFPMSETKQNMLQSALQLWGEKDPIAAGMAIAALPSNEKNSTLRGLAQGWSTKSVESFKEGAEWSVQLPTVEKSVFLESALSNLSFYYPEKAAEFLKNGGTRSAIKQQNKRIYINTHCYFVNKAL